jgi:hypothetical protein
LNGNVTADGGASLTERGFYTKTSSGVTTSDTKQLASGTTTGAYTLAVTGLSVNTRYYFKSYASNSAGTSLSSTEQDFWTLANAPSAPTLSSATTSGFSVAVNENSNPASTEFAIRVGAQYVQANGTLGVSEVWQSKTTWDTRAVTGLSPGTQYTVDVKARNGANTQTAFGTSANITTAGVPEIALQSPTGTEIASGGSRESLGTVTVGSNADFTFRVVNSGSAALSVTEIAFGGDNSGDFSVQGSPSFPVSVAAGANQDFTIRFTPGADGARAGTVTFANNDSDEGSYVINLSGTGSAAATAPTVTSSAASSITATTATLNGNINSDGGAAVTERGFVYSSSATTPTLDAGGVTQVTVSGTTGAMNEAVTGLAAATTIYFRAYAINSVGTTYGAVQNFTTLKAEPISHATSLAVGTATTSSLPLTWTAASAQPDGYVILVSSTTVTDPVDGTAVSDSTDVSGGTGAVNVAGSATNYASFTGFAAGTTYTFKIYPYNNSGGDINYLTAATVPSVTGLLLPAAPETPTFASVTSTGFTVNWNAVSGADSYRLDVSTASNFATFVSGYQDLTVAGTSQAVTGLAANTTYHARVRAVNTSGAGANSTSGNQTTSQLSAPTTLAASSITSSGFTANWNAVAEAMGYELTVSSLGSGTTVAETFSGITGSATSYLSRSWTGVGGISWTAEKARTDQVVDTGNAAITLQNDTGAFIESGEITGGVTQISFDVLQVFSGSGGVLTVKVLYGSGFTTETTVGTIDYTTTKATFSEAVSGVDGSYKIRIDNNTSARPAIDNLAFTSAGVSTPVDGYNGLDVGNVTSYAITGLDAETEYSYVVRATSATSTSANSDVQTVTTAAAPAITVGGTLTALNTTYGTASSTTSFTVSGANIAGGITVTPPAGFEVAASADFTTTIGTSVAPLVIGGAGTIAGTTVYVRLPATAGVSGSPYSGDISVTSSGAASQTIATASSSVAAKALTITGLTPESKSWDGTTSATVTGTAAFEGLVNGDSLTPEGSVSWAFADANVGADKTLVRTGDYTVSSADYTVTQPTLTASINAAVPSVPTISEITVGDQQLSVAFTAPASNGGASITNYEYSLNGGSTWVTPDPAGTSSPLLITGLTNGTPYDVQIRAVNSAGGGTATATSQATPEAPAVPTLGVAPATFASALSTTYGTASSTANFTVTGSALNGSQVTVTPAAGLEVSTSSNFTTTVGTSSSPLSLGTSASISTTVYVRLAANAAAGNYDSASISVSGGGADAQSVATSSSGNSVAPKVVTITGLSATGKVYDGTTSVTITGTAAYDGLANGESHSVTDSVTWTFPDKNIGTGKVLSRSASYTAPNANYTLSEQPSLTADITAKELTGSFTANNKAFDNSTVATVATRAVSGAIEGDTVNHTGGTATFADADVGNGKTVTLESATLTGADAGNYTLTSVSTTTANITQGAASITFGSLPAGKKVGDAAFSAGATTTLGTISYSSSNTAVATVNASTGSITLVAPGVTTITATVAGEANFTGATASQTLNVGGAGNLNLASDLIITGIIDGPRSGGTPKAIEIYVVRDIPDLSIYDLQSYNNGGTTASTTFALTGSATAGSFLYFASESTEFTAFFGFAPTATTSAVNVNGDDVVALRKDGEIVDVFGTIGERPSTIDTSFNYVDTWFYRNADALPTATFTLGDWSFPEGQSDALDSLTTGTNPAEGDPLRMPVGTYSISTAATPGITATGSFAAVSTTYGTASAASATTATVTGGSLTADITATAPTGFQVSSDGTTYGSTAIFTQTDGFANGTLYLRLAANAAVGSYNDQVVTLSSTGASNQTLAIANSTVSQKALTVTAEAKSKVFGAADPALTYTTDGLVAGDSLTGSLARAAGENVGTYAISQGSLANANYNISFTGADLTITAAALPNITWSGGAISNSNGVASFSYAYSGVSSNGISTTYSNSLAPTNAGYYTVVATSTDGNYSGSSTNTYFVAGPVLADDTGVDTYELRKPQDNGLFYIDMDVVLANDKRIDSSGAVQTNGLSISAVTTGLSGGSGTVSFSSPYILYTPTDGAEDAFFYTVIADGVSATAKVTVVPETNEDVPSFTLQFVTKGTAVFTNGNTVVSHDFLGVPDKSYALEYSTNLSSSNNWVSAGSINTGGTGSFTATLTATNTNVATPWNNSMFFRAKVNP